MLVFSESAGKVPKKKGNLSSHGALFFTGNFQEKYQNTTGQGNKTFQMFRSFCQVSGKVLRLQGRAFFSLGISGKSSQKKAFKGGHLFWELPGIITQNKTGRIPNKIRTQVIVGVRVDGTH